MLYHQENDAGVAMLNSVASNDIQTIEEAITNFKQYIKRNLVDLHYASAYVKVLTDTYHTRELSILSFSTLCHLIKRISIQDPYVLQQIYNPIIPFLLQRLTDHKDSIRLTSLKSLKTCIDSAPRGNVDPLISCLISDGLKVSDYQIQLQTLDLLFQIMDPTAKLNFSFKLILSNLIKLLNSPNFTVSLKSGELIKLYFNEINVLNNNTAKSDMLNELISNSVPSNIAIELLKSIDPSLCNKYNSFLNPEKKETLLQSENDPATNYEKLNYMLNQIPNWNVDDSSIKPISIDDTDLTYDMLQSEIDLAFDGRETEKNWKTRQSLITKLRQILRGENFLTNINKFIIFLKNIRDSIPKGMLSLRTTLSNTSCQFIKELAIFAGSFLDSLFLEPILTNLIKLTSARKIMQHQNANVAIIAILLYTNLSSRIFNILNSTIHEKSIQPRVYTGNWIQLILLKYYDLNNLENTQFLVESIEPTLVKGLSDPIPQVKDAMRNAFWTLCEFEPSYESIITKKLDYATVKALERSKAMYINNNNNVLKQISMADVNNKERNNSRQDSYLFGKSSASPKIVSNRYESQKEQENIQQQHKLHYEPVRKSTRSESWDENKLTQKKKKQQPAVRNHTVDVRPSLNQQPTVQTSVLSTTNTPANNNDDSIDEFTGRIKRENIIYEEITSDSKSVQAEGFEKLLKENNSSFSIKFHSALNNLSILNPELFDIIFMSDNEAFFNKISGYISTENVLRLFCLYLIKSNDYDRIEFVINNLSLEDLCLSIINILNFAIDASRIDNINLSIQYIKNRFNLINSILKILSKLITLKKDVVKSYLLSSIFECLMTSFGIVDDSEIKEEFIHIFQLCLTEYDELFKRSLKELDNITLKKDICTTLGIPLNVVEYQTYDVEMHNTDEYDDQLENKTKLLSPIKVNKEEFDENIDEMTKVIPRLTSRDNNHQNGKLFSDLTMILPKRKGDGLFDFDKIELKHEEQASRELSVGVEDVISEIEKEEEEEEEEKEEEEEEKEEEKNNGEIIIKEQGELLPEHDVAISMKEKNDVDETVEEFEIEKSESFKEEKAGETLEIEDAALQENDLSMLEKEKTLMSDSTPDMNQLTIDEQPKEVDGYLGLVIDELLENKKNEVKEQNSTRGNLVSILQNINSIDCKKSYSELLEQLTGEYVIEVLAVIRVLIESLPELMQGSVIEKFNEVLDDNFGADEIFLGVLEIVEIFDTKSIVGLPKIHKLKDRMQEILLGCILNKMVDNLVDCEDIFMIERIINRTCESEDSYIRMNSYLIYREMYRMFVEKTCDNAGIELVDNMIIDGMKDEVKRFCGLEV